MHLGELARALGVELRGDPAVEVESVAPLSEASPGTISFAVGSQYREAALASQASALLVPPDLSDLAGNLLVTPNVYLALAKLLERFHPLDRPAAGVHPSAFVPASASLGEGVSIGPLASVGERARIGARTVLGSGSHVGDDCVIGEDCWIHSGALVRERVTLGDRVILQPGSVIGSDGFGYAPTREGWAKIPQVGTVVLEDDVEVGANTTIDRATLGATRIGKGTKLDNLIQIAHNVTVGEHSAFAAQVGVAGSTRIGKRVQLGGQVGVAGHIEIGDGARLGAQSGVPADIPAGANMMGRPPVPQREFWRIKAAVLALPELRGRIRELERNVEELRGALAAMRSDD